MRKKGKNHTKNEGITLIALVITIIVLIVLSAVTINLIIGKDGIIAKAKDASEETRGARVEEEKELWNVNKKMDEYMNKKTAPGLDDLLNDLKNKNLITEEEKNIIKSTGRITIGRRTIAFNGTDTSTEINWSTIVAYANKYPEKYAYPGQESTVKDIGIGTDGKPVNMGLWKFEVWDNKIVLFGGSQRFRV